MAPLCAFLGAIGLLAAPLAAKAQAQDPAPTKVRNAIALFSCVTPGGTYKVAVRAIISVSSHEYVVDGTRVTEVNIDTGGNALVRFYHLEILPTQAPLGIGQGALDKLNSAAKELSSRTETSDVWKKVVKSYPTSTHAHTIEYRLAEKSELMKIFESANEAFSRQKEVEITVP